MALAEPLKKGGRYTKKEQEERKIQVYHLHFEENKSAAKIAELLNVNRNTINDDISYWHSQLANEMKSQDLTAKMTKQIQRMEIQRDRLLEDLEESENLDERIRLERFISDIDNRLVQLYSKMISSGIKNLEPTVKLEEIDEDEIKEFVRDLIFLDEDPNSEDVYSENELKFEFIRRTKCDINYVNNVIEKMERDGLVLCEPRQMGPRLLVFSSDSSTKYNISKFGDLRGYLTFNELISITKKRNVAKQELERQEEKEEIETERAEKKRLEKFVKKYGEDKLNWPKEVKDLFYHTDDDP